MYRKWLSLCMLTLYLTALIHLSVLIVFCWRTQSSLIISSANRDNYAFFVICMDFISFSCTVVLGKISSSIFRKGIEGRFFSWSWYQGNILRFFSHLIWCWQWTCTTFIMLGYSGSILHLFRAFIMRYIEFYQEIFSPHLVRYHICL